MARPKTSSLDRAEQKRAHDAARDPVRDANRVAVRFSEDEIAALDGAAIAGETRAATVRRLALAAAAGARKKTPRR